MRFLVLLILLNGLYIAEKRLSGRFLDLPYTSLVTWASARAGELLLPIPVTQRGPITLGSDDAAVVIRAGCNGLEAIFLLLAGILAFPATWKDRIRGIMVYIPVLFGANVLRVLLLLYIVTRHPQLTDFFHYQIAQGVLVLFIAILWMHYVQTSSK